MLILIFWRTMEPAAPVPGCDYITPANTSTWDIIRDLLQMHVTAAQPAGPQYATAVRPKPGPVSRPEIDLGASEADWRFFIDEFGRYKHSTGIAGQTILDEIWHWTEDMAQLTSKI